MNETEQVRTQLTKLRDWTDDEGREPDENGTYEWPAPPEYTEYRVEGQMRSDVLTRIGRPSDDTCEVRLIEGSIEGGYSEWTVEFDYPIEVWIHEDRQSQKVYDDTTYWQDDAFAGFLRWLLASPEEQS